MMAEQKFIQMYKYGRYLNMKYALIENNIVKVVSYQPVDGWEEVSDDIYGDMVRKEDGTFDYTDEFKATHRPE